MTREDPDLPASSPAFHPVRSLRFWLTAAAILALLAVGTGAVSTLVTRQLVQDSTTELTERLRPAQGATQQLLTAYVDQESGQRGFVLTADGAFLDPYRSGARKSAELEDRLAVLLRGDPEALRLLADVSAAGQTWQRHVAAEIVEVRENGTGGHDKVAHQRQEKELFDSLRDRLEALRADVDGLVDDEVEQVATAQDRVDAAMVVAVVLAVFALVATMGLLRFALTRPLRELIEQLGVVSAGDYERHIDAEGPEEVRQIAEAAETMRVSVVDRSTELVAAQHELSVQTERQRVAADLHDTTIQRLFGLGLRLSALASQRPELAGTLNSMIDEADEIIRELRRMIFEMGGTQAGVERPSPDRLRS
ncbi:CHASE3 domain-containing protein [Nocardioides sp. MAHUQ-72]|uniref:CHASE3 domain-containing protein n=1 Tax=unclassified Nocardioides TaxID=2615069 RepID=UPI00361AED4C